MPRQDGDKIECNIEMLEAGIEAFALWGGDVREVAKANAVANLVKAIHLAMETERLRSQSGTTQG